MFSFLSKKKPYKSLTREPIIRGINGLESSLLGYLFLSTIFQGHSFSSQILVAQTLDEAVHANLGANFLKIKSGGRGASCGVGDDSFLWREIE